MQAEDQYYLKIFLRYIGLTYFLSWIIWILIPVLNHQNYFVNFWIAVLGLYGPSIAGILLSFKFQGTYWQHYVPEWRIFSTIFVFSSFIGIEYMRRLVFLFPAIGELSIGVIILILIASFLTAYLMSLMRRSPPGFETRNDKPFQVRSQIGMLVFALSLPLIIGLVSFSIQITIAPETNNTTLIDLISSTFQLPFFLFSFSFLFSGAANEEIGWRGYLTPKMLQRVNPLATGLIIGIVWSIWHLPLHAINFYGDGIEGIWFRLMWNIPMGIVFTWYYIKSGYNLLGAIILHGAFNLFSFIGDFYVIPAYILTAIIMIIESKMWKTNYIRSVE